MKKLLAVLAMAIVCALSGWAQAQVEWVARTTPAGGAWLNVAYGNGLFVAVAESGTNRVMTSPDGINWTLRPSADDSMTWYGVTYGNGLFVAVASGGSGSRVMTSPDGVNWTSRTAAADSGWTVVTYGKGLFVAVANSGTTRVMTSPDGINWTAQSAAAASTWRSVTYGNGLFVAVADTGDPRVMTSPDGISWTGRTAAAARSWHSVTFGNGLFVAVAYTFSGQSDLVMKSSDGINWTSSVPAALRAWFSIGYGNGVFVATGAGNSLMTSDDGTTWISRTPPLTGNWRGSAYGNGRYVVVSYTTGDPTQRVMTSDPPPTVTAVSPTSGTTAGGTAITITGTDFTGATAVTIGGSACTNVTVVSSTSITCTTPAGAVGMASVLVTTLGGTNAANTLFTYVVTSFTVGGSVSGLGTGKTVVLQNNAGDDLTVSANGNFTFATSVLSGNAYAVTIKTQPAGQQCVVSGGSGNVATSNVSAAVVQCFDRVAATSSLPGGPVSATVTGGTCAGFDGSSITFAAPVNPPPNAGSFKFGVFGFTAKACGSGGTITVTLKYPSVLPPGTRYWKQVGGAWVDWTNKVAISGDSVTLTVTDGGEGDNNPAPGEISDPSGPAFLDGAFNVPVFSPWVLAALGLMLGFAGYRHSRR